jgi:hypothetical protein
MEVADRRPAGAPGSIIRGTSRRRIGTLPEAETVAKLLGRIERALEDAVEGTSRRLFRARLQPVELAKAASRAMQAEQVIGPEGPEVPNRFRIRLHPGDFSRFASYRQSLESRIAGYLDRFAGDRGLRPVADWQVDIVADTAVRPRRIRVDAEMADVAPPGNDRSPSNGAGLEGTAPLPRVEPEAPVRVAPGSAVHAVLLAEDGRQLGLAGEVTTLGRALDNDVVIADSRVSRYHAQIRRVRAGYVVRDLGSTNGTSVAGRRTNEQRLADGDEISLGGFKVALRLREA